MRPYGPSYPSAEESITINDYEYGYEREYDYEHEYGWVKGMRLGIMGGTFDPIHYAHLFIAEEARTRLELDRVLFVPNGMPPHKKDYEITPAGHRLAMVELATRDNPSFAASRSEIDRPGPSYTVDTLKQIHAEQPGAELFFITGMDAVAEILTWRSSDEVLSLARILAVNRPGFAADKSLPNLENGRVELLDAPHLGISSTLIRERVAQSVPIRYLAPEPVVAYIEEHGLYRAQTDER